MEEDLEGIFQLLEIVNLPTEGVEENFENFFVIRSNNMIIGCIGLEIFGQDGLIRSVAIHPSLQKQRLGHRLVLRIQKYSIEIGLKRLYLLTETAESFFTRFDFKIIPRHQINSNIKQSIEFTKLCTAAPVLKKSLYQK